MESRVASLVYPRPMCGRFTLTSPVDEISGYFRVLTDAALEPRYNIAPTQPVVAVRVREGGDRRLAELRWGLIPYWAKDPAIGNRMINARAETAAQKTAYKEPVVRRRCLVLADGFYEWQKVKGGPKQPYFMSMTDGKSFAFAGLWDRWRPRGDQLEELTPAARATMPLNKEGRVESCSFVTTEPNKLLAPIHDRMPVIVPPELWDTWLDPEVQEAAALGEILRPYPAELMQAHPVTTHVNNPANDDPECIKAPPQAQDQAPGGSSRPAQATQFV